MFLDGSITLQYFNFNVLSSYTFEISVKYKNITSLACKTKLETGDPCNKYNLLYIMVIGNN